jgi:hypothetical protein
MREYAVIYERGGAGEENWGAYVPDLPGCITTGGLSTRLGVTSARQSISTSKG